MLVQQETQTGPPTVWPPIVYTWSNLNFVTSGTNCA